MKSLRQTLKTITEKFHTGIKSSDDSEYYEVYKNPEPSEISDLIKQGKSYYGGKEPAARWGITENGDVYTWYYTMMHYVVEKNLKIHFVAQGLVYYYKGFGEPPTLELSSKESNFKYPTKEHWKRSFGRISSAIGNNTQTFLDNWREQ